MFFVKMWIRFIEIVSLLESECANEKHIRTPKKIEKIFKHMIRLKLIHKEHIKAKL